MNIVLRYLSEANKIDSCGDHKAPSLSLEIKDYKRLLSDLKKRGIKVRYITDITKDNIKYCKELMVFFDEIRHIDGIKANFSVSEKEYLASASSLQKVQDETEQLQEDIYSNVKEIVK